MECDLTRLGSREFEHLTRALVVKVLGAGAGVFGDGPDGGRQATRQGRSAVRALDFFVADPLHHYMETGILTGIKARAEGRFSDADDAVAAEAPAAEPPAPPT